MSIIEGQKINNTFFISINNPKSKNSMVLGFHPQLQSKIDEAENSKDINSIIIFGEGGFFCAGGDLNSLKTRRDMTVPERLETLEQLNGTIKKIKECSKPTIAAVEGGAAGAGVSLAMACDFLIMSDKSFLSLAYVKIGLTPDGGVTKLLAEVLPKQILSEMALIGDRIFAKKLFDLYPGTVVLKGKETIVYDGGSFSICPAGNPGMAVGGMGDVLSGMISGYLAQGLSSKEASILGVFHHAVACDSLQENYGQRSLRPSILLDHLVDLEL